MKVSLLQRPIAVFTWSAVLFVAGVWMALRIPLEWTPRIELPEVRIQASWPGAAPRSVERYVTAPIERAVQGVAGTAHIESLSEEGTASVILGVSPEADLATYIAEINDQLTRLRSSLPDRVVPRLTRQVPEALREEQGFMTLQLVGDLTPEALRRLAERQVAPRLRSLSSLADVEVRGGRATELRITLDPDRLAAFGLSPGAAQAQLAQILQDDVYGRIRGEGEAQMLFKAAATEAAEIRAIVLSAEAARGRVIRLEDVARVELAGAPTYFISRVDGQPVVTLNLDRAPGSHMLNASNGVRDAIETLRLDLPEGVRLLVADDRSEAVREQLADLVGRGGAGLVLVMLVLLFMLRSVRAMLVVLSSVAIALSVGFLMMGLMGLSINLITLAGLVLVFGLLVDNSVVIVEQLALQRKRHAAKGLEGLELDQAAARDGLKTVWLPLLGGTLSTAAIMLPLIYLSGELRVLFVPFGVLVGLTLGVSLVTAAWFLPVVARKIPLEDYSDASRRSRLGRILRRWVAAPYQFTARFPKLMAVGLLLLLGVPIWLLPNNTLFSEESTQPRPVKRLHALYDATLGHESILSVREWLDPALGGVLRPFFRSVNFGPAWSYQTRPEVYTSLRFPTGNTIERADSLIQLFEQTALADPSVSRTLATINERRAFLRVQFAPEYMASSNPYIVRERLIGRAVGMAGISVSIGGLLPEAYSSGFGVGISGQRLVATGPNYDHLEQLAQRFADQAKKSSRRVVGVDINAGRRYRQDDREVLRYRWNADTQLRSRVPAEAMAAHLRPVLNTRFPTFYANLESETRVPIRIVMKGAEELDVGQLTTQPLLLDDSTLVRLADAAAFDVEVTPAGIERINQQYSRYLAVDFRGPMKMANDFIDGQLAAFAVPHGYRLEKSSYSFFEENEVKEAFGWVILGTLLLIFLITASVFESWRLPWLVMLSVPMATVGVAAGFLLTGANFAEGAFIGVVLLLGISVNDSMLLVDRYRQLRRLRPTIQPIKLIRLAVRNRLRPMWTTTLTSVVAMLPLLIFPDQGDFWMGLAVTVVGGLLAGTLLSPVATVALVAARHT